MFAACNHHHHQAAAAAFQTNVTDNVIYGWILGLQNLVLFLHLFCYHAKQHNQQTEIEVCWLPLQYIVICSCHSCLECGFFLNGSLIRAVVPNLS